jgi:hypothetical protein
MKLKHLIYIASLAMLVISAGTGCKKTDFNINKNPNQATDSTVSYDVILPAALNATGAAVGLQYGFLQNWMGYWARSGTYAPDVIEETYQITTTFGTGIWNSYYDNLFDYQTMEIKAEKAGADFYTGIARIMKAHNYQMLVDVYGNIPYSEALKGNALPTPKYEKGIDIYKDLLRQIDAGIELIKDADVSLNKDIATNDIMFAGDKTRWVKFANTLKLRMLIHAHAIPAIDKAAEIAIIETEGNGYLEAGQNAQVNPGYKSDKPNPFFNTFKTDVTGEQTDNNVYYRANEWGIDYYSYNLDNRIARFYEAGSQGYLGVAYGLPPITANSSPNLAGIGPGVYKTNTASQAILTAAESFFLQAEARHRGWITLGPDAESLVNSGIIESFNYVGASGSATYISNNAGYPDVDYTAGIAPGAPAGYPTGGLFTILSQKWFALNAINTLEVWTDYRRVPYSEVASSSVNDHFVYGAGVGYDPGPPISVSPQNTSTKIPVRLLYPQTEYNYNATNVGAEGTVDQFTSRIFWDLN